MLLAKTNENRTKSWKALLLPAENEEYVPQSVTSSGSVCEAVSLQRRNIPTRAAAVDYRDKTRKR